MDLRPKELKAFSDRVAEIARAAGFAPHPASKPSETFARFYKLGDSPRGGGHSAVDSGPAPSEVLAPPPESIDPPQADQAPPLEAMSPSKVDQTPPLEAIGPPQAEPSLPPGNRPSPSPPGSSSGSDEPPPGRSAGSPVNAPMFTGPGIDPSPALRWDAGSLSGPSEPQ